MLEGYEKIGIIGKGSFGTASLYTRLKDNKLVVLKEITTSDMDYEEKSSSYNEIKILSALNHSNIIRYFDSVIKQDFFIIIMDYADGGNLAQLINFKKSKNEAFKEKGIFFIVFQISSALSYMHAMKILHRDLKSANIFITANGTIKVGDFGISKMLSTKSQAQTVLGTPYYLSPEMCEGHQYDEKSDIWAVGCILYEMAALKRPFNAPNLPLLVQKIIKCEYDDIPYFYSKDLKILLELILQKKTVFRPTAKFIHDIIIPDILTKTGIHFDYDQIKENNNNTIRYRERSVLYEITNADGEIGVQPKNLPHKTIVDFSLSSTHSVAIFKDHSVYAWGSNKYCELGVNSAEIFVEHPVYVKSLEHLDVIKCATGDSFSLFLTKYGQVYSCGHGATGCLGHGNLSNVYFPILIRSLSKTIIKYIICGSRHAVALDLQGKIYVWGSPKFGHPGFDNTGKICSIPIHLQIQEEIQKIFCADDSTIILSVQNSIFVRGNNKYQKLGIKNDKNEIIPDFRKVKRNFGEVLNISISKTHTVIVNTGGGMFLLGDNTSGQLGKNNGMFKKYEHFLKLENKVLQSTCTDAFTAVYDEKNILWFWGTFKSIEHKDKGNENLVSDSSKNQVSLSAYQNEAHFANKPKLAGNDRDDNSFFKGNQIQDIKSILALYSSKDNLKSGNYIKIRGIKAKGNSIFLLVDTTCPAPYKRFSEPYNLNNHSKMSHATTKTYCSTSRTK